MVTMGQSMHVRLWVAVRRVDTLTFPLSENLNRFSYQLVLPNMAEVLKTGVCK